MKNKNLWLTLFFSLTAMILSIFFASCEWFPSTSKLKTGNDQRNLSSSEYDIEDVKENLALIHSTQDFYRSQTELQEQVVQILQSEDARTTRIISNVKSYIVTIEDGFSSVTANRRSEVAEKEISEISFYIFTLEN